MAYHQDGEEHELVGGLLEMLRENKDRLRAKLKTRGHIIDQMIIAELERQMPGADESGARAFRRF